MYTLHIANKNYSSWSLRPWILMEQLSIPFKEELLPFTEGSNWVEFRKFSPSGLVPLLIDGNSEIWDSLAITEYLSENHSAIWPEEKNRRTWARCATSEMHAGFFALRNQCPMSCGVRIQLNNIDEALQKDISRIDELWSQGIEKFGGPFLAGTKFTAVDAFFAPVVFRVRTYGLSLSHLASSYAEHMLSIESMLRWEKEALQESWREPGHERDCIKSGVMLEDSRSA